MSEKNECADNVEVEWHSCKMPCVGIFADIWEVDSRRKENLSFLESYQNYKKFYETTEGKY